MECAVEEATSSSGECVLIKLARSPEDRTRVDSTAAINDPLIPMIDIAKLLVAAQAPALGFAKSHHQP
jgi:hypothetical protein